MRNNIFLSALMIGLISLSTFGARAALAEQITPTHNIDYSQSHVYFSAAHAGKAFSGQFTDWQGEVSFDPAHLEQSSITAQFTLSEAKTGNKMFDGTLPSADWFDVKNHPKAAFQTTKITANAEGTYQAEGTLTLRGITLPVAFSFTVSDLAVDPVLVKAQFEVDRLAYGIGKSSDGKAEWVSQMIGLNLEITAHAQ
jgi:polyisoprenoid-binding protein YceI